MPVSGLVAILDDDTQVEHVERALRAAPGVVVGQRLGRRLALTLEAEDEQQRRARFEQLRTAPGVAHIDVVFVEVEPPSATPGASG